MLVHHQRSKSWNSDDELIVRKRLVLKYQKYISLLCLKAQPHHLQRQGCRKRWISDLNSKFLKWKALIFKNLQPITMSQVLECRSIPLQEIYVKILVLLYPIQKTFSNVIRLDKNLYLVSNKLLKKRGKIKPWSNGPW